MSRYNPFVILTYYLCFSLIPMLDLNPILLVISLFFAILQAFLCPEEIRKSLGGIFILTLIFALIHPLFSRNGQTVLLVIGDRLITKEALLFALCSALAMGCVLILFRIFSMLMSTDRVLYLLSSLSPSASLTLSIAMKTVSDLPNEYRKITLAQEAIGNGEAPSLLASLRFHTRCISILITRLLEDGVTTADSMDARGYGQGKRTAYRLYRFTKRDGAALALILALTAVSLIGVITGKTAFDFYPTLSSLPMENGAILIYLGYAVLGALPIIPLGKEKMTWKSCAQTA